MRSTVALLQGSNYAAAILGDRIYNIAGKWVGNFVDGLLVLFVAVAFAIGLPPRRRMLYIVGGIVTLLLIEYLLWQNFGIFFESIIPIILLTGHWYIEDKRHIRKELERLRECERNQGQPSE